MRNGMRLIRFAMQDEERRKLYAFLDQNFHADMGAIQAQSEASQFVQWTAERREALARYPGPHRFGPTGIWDCEPLYYLLCKLA
jgi:hypothetical protein